MIRRTLFTSGTTLYVDHCRSVEIEDVGIDSSFLRKEPVTKTDAIYESR